MNSKTTFQLLYREKYTNFDIFIQISYRALKDLYNKFLLLSCISQDINVEYVHLLQSALL